MARPPSSCLVALALLAAGCIGDQLQPFTAAERTGLVVSADSITHPTLGFSAPNPQGAYSRSPELQRRVDSSFAGHNEMAVWALTGAGGGNVIIQATKFSRLTEDLFRAYIRGFRREAVRQADAVLEDTVTWSTRGEYRLEIRVQRAFLRTRCLSRGGTNNVIVCLQAAAVDSTGIGEVPAGLTLAE
ncbi:MAG TPA: hypothetical protein VH163_01900 [Gemmatimonadales bacterium]|jgi:hypothetical protein|nr:hypothetical protein [Gemmatimonadales bacterium]